MITESNFRLVLQSVPVHTDKTSYRLSDGLADAAQHVFMQVPPCFRRYINADNVSLSDGAVTFDWVHHGDMVTLEVSESGIGMFRSINGEIRESVFEGTSVLPAQVVNALRIMYKQAGI